MIRIILLAWAAFLLFVGPARASENLEIFQGPAHTQDGDIAAQSEGMLAKRAQNIPRNIPARADVSAADATALLCPGRGALAPLFQAAAERYRIRPVVLVAMARVESSCDPRAVNRRTGAVGLMQVLPSGSANVDHIVDPDELIDPATNIELGARHMRKMVNLCGTLAGGLSVYHGNRRCSQHSGDGYVAKVLGLVTWAKRTIARLQKVRS